MLFEENSTELTVKEASVLASKIARRQVTTSNIQYLIRYGVLRQVKGTSFGCILNEEEVISYFQERAQRLEDSFRNSIDSELNWRLSFTEYREAETTKHVHRIHPYKGKFIPQLVEYFVGPHTDEFKSKRPRLHYEVHTRFGS